MASISPIEGYVAGIYKYTKGDIQNEEEESKIMDLVRLEASGGKEDAIAATPIKNIPSFTAGLPFIKRLKDAPIPRHTFLVVFLKPDRTKDYQKIDAIKNWAEVPLPDLYVARATDFLLTHFIQPDAKSEEDVRSITEVVKMFPTVLILYQAINYSSRGRKSKKKKNKAVEIDPQADIIGACTFLPAPSSEPTKIDCLVDWICVLHDSAKKAPAQLGTWRNMGFGSLLIIAMLKFLHMVLQLESFKEGAPPPNWESTSVEVFLQCTIGERGANYFYRSIGFIAKDLPDNGLSLLPPAVIEMVNNAAEPEDLFIARRKGNECYLMILRNWRIRDFSKRGEAPIEVEEESEERIQEIVAETTPTKGRKARHTQMPQDTSNLWCFFPRAQRGSAPGWFLKRALDAQIDRLPLMSHFFPGDKEAHEHEVYTWPTSCQSFGYVTLYRRLGYKENTWLSVWEVMMLVLIATRSQERREAIFVIPLDVVKHVQLAYTNDRAYNLGNLEGEEDYKHRSTVDKILQYLGNNLTILDHKIVCFPMNKDECHWTMDIAINPLVSAERNAVSPNDEISGFIVTDSLQSAKGENHCLTHQGFVWFLNLAYSYRAYMEAEGNQGNPHMGHPASTPEVTQSQETVVSDATAAGLSALAQAAFQLKKGGEKDVRLQEDATATNEGGEDSCSPMDIVSPDAPGNVNNGLSDDNPATAKPMDLDLASSPSDDKEDVVDKNSPAPMDIEVQSEEDKDHDVDTVTEKLPGLDLDNKQDIGATPNTSVAKKRTVDSVDLITPLTSSSQCEVVSGAGITPKNLFSPQPQQELTLLFPFGNPHSYDKERSIFRGQENFPQLVFQHPFLPVQPDFFNCGLAVSYAAAIVYEILDKGNVEVMGDLHKINSGKYEIRTDFRPKYHLSGINTFQQIRLEFMILIDTLAKLTFSKKNAFTSICSKLRRGGKHFYSIDEFFEKAQAFQQIDQPLLDSHKDDKKKPPSEDMNRDKKDRDAEDMNMDKKDGDVDGAADDDDMDEGVAEVVETSPSAESDAEAEELPPASRGRNRQQQVLDDLASTSTDESQPKAVQEKKKGTKQLKKAPVGKMKTRSKKSSVSDPAAKAKGNDDASASGSEYNPEKADDDNQDDAVDDKSLQELGLVPTSRKRLLDSLGVLVEPQLGDQVPAGVPASVETVPQPCASGELCEVPGGAITSKYLPCARCEFGVHPRCFVMTKVGRLCRRCHTQKTNYTCSNEDCPRFSHPLFPEAAKKCNKCKLPFHETCMSKKDPELCFKCRKSLTTEDDEEEPSNGPRTSAWGCAAAELCLHKFRLLPPASKGHKCQHCQRPVHLQCLKSRTCLRCLKERKEMNEQQANIGKEFDVEEEVPVSKKQKESRPANIPELDNSRKRTSVFHYGVHYRQKPYPEKPFKDTGKWLPIVEKPIVPSGGSDVDSDDEEIRDEREFEEFHQRSIASWGWAPVENRQKYIEARNEEIRNMEDDEAKQDSRADLAAEIKMWKQGRRQLFREWCLTTAGTVLGIKYNNNQEFTLKVAYMKRGERKKGRKKKEKHITYVTCPYEELKGHFDERVIQHVYSCARDEIKDNSGFYFLPKKMVDSSNLPRFKQYNLVKMRYVPARHFLQKKRLKTMDSNLIHDTETKYKHIEARWEGIQADGSLVNNIDENWIVENFGQRFTLELSTRAASDFVPIPVGAVRKSLLSTHRYLCLENAPAMEYNQGQRNLCLFYSTASVLHYLGFPEVGRELAAFGCDEEGRSDTLKRIKTFLDGKLPSWLQRKRLSRGYDWDSLPPNSFATIVLETTKGDTGHGVCITNGMVFDSNEEEAIKLSKPALDYCVDPDHVDKFMTIHDGWAFYERGKKNRLAKMRKEA